MATSILFWSCKKEILTPVKSEASNAQVRKPTITLEQAQQFFDSVTQKLTSTSNLDLPNSLLGLRVPDFNNQYTCYNKNNQEFFCAPIKDFRINNGCGGVTFMVWKTPNKWIVGDSILNGAWVMYIPDSAYHYQCKGRYDPKTFTGIVSYCNFIGIEEISLRVENGNTVRRMKGSVIQSGSNSTAFRTINDIICDYYITAELDPFVFHATNSIHLVYHFYCYDDGGGGNLSTTPTFGDGNVGGGDPTVTTGSNFANNKPSFTNYSFSAKTILKNLGYSDDQYNNLVGENSDLDVAIKKYFDLYTPGLPQRLAVTANLENVDATTLQFFLKSLTDNKLIYDAFKAANFPPIGTSDWLDVYDALLRKFVKRGLSNAEKNLARISPSSESQINFEAQIVAVFTTKSIYGANDGPNNDRNIANSFQHAYWNSVVAAALGKEIANKWGNAHEDGYTDIASQMDYWNNDQGSKIGALLKGPTPSYFNLNKSLIQSLAKRNVLLAIANGEMKYVCVTFDPVNVLIVTQTLKFTNQPCS